MIDWNKRYQAGDTPWEKGAPAPPLLELLEKKTRAIWGDGTVLAPGCGTGHDVRALAAAGFTVLGLDLATEAIRRAEAQPPAGSETYTLADFLDPAWRSGKSFSAIWEHTCYCAIDPSMRSAYATACAELIPSGGRLIGVFFLTPYDPGEAHEGPPHPATIAELDELFSENFAREDAWIPGKAYPGREGREWIAIYRRK